MLYPSGKVRYGVKLKVLFRNNTLRKQYQKSTEAEKAFGQQVGRKYIQRINIIKSAKSVSDLTAIRALKCHELKGDRKGEWSIKLTGFYRLIFTVEGSYLEIARIEEVSKHYGD